MIKKRKHSKAEIAAKLVQASDMAAQGKLQSEIAQALSVSIMTLHRWRKEALRAAERDFATCLGLEPEAGETRRKRLVEADR